MIALLIAIAFLVLFAFAIWEGNKAEKKLNSLINLILLKLNDMGKELDAIKQQLVDADAKTDKIAADVKHLHDLIENAGETPTAEQWQEVKDAATALNNKLQGIDDSTEDA